MKKMILALVFCFWSATAFAIVNTGDAALDESLNSLSEQVKNNPEEFIKVNLGLRFNQPADKLIGFLKKEKLEVSEVFTISYFSASMTKDLDTVMADYKENGKNLAKFLESYNVIKGKKEYRKYYQSSINIHPKPFIPSKNKK